MERKLREQERKLREQERESADLKKTKEELERKIEELEKKREVQENPATNELVDELQQSVRSLKTQMDELRQQQNRPVHGEYTHCAYKGAIVTSLIDYDSEDCGSFIGLMIGVASY